jgi:hypothetical protein
MMRSLNYIYWSMDTMSVHHIDVYCERVSISCFIVSDATNASVDRPRFVW